MGIHWYVLLSMEWFHLVSLRVVENRVLIAVTFDCRYLEGVERRWTFYSSKGLR